MKETKWKEINENKLLHIISEWSLLILLLLASWRSCWFDESKWWWGSSGQGPSWSWGWNRL